MKDLLEHLSAAGLNPVVIDENTVFPTPTQSCFLPGTNIQFAWDSTSLGYIKTCPRLYQYIMIEGWSSLDDNIHLRFGIEYHQALHDYETARQIEDMEHGEALFRTVKLLVSRLHDYPKVHPAYKPSLRNKTRWNLLRTVIWYLDKFKPDPAETIVLDDGKPALEVSFKFELDWGPNYQDYVAHKATPTETYLRFPDGTGFQPYLLCGHLDRIVTFNSELFTMDRKTTTGSLTDYYFSQFEPNNQMTLYTIAGKVVLGSSVRGVIIDAASVGPNETKFQRAFTYRSEDILQEWLHNLRVLLAQAEAYATEGYWPQNDTACDKYGGCRFKEICSKPARVRQNFLEGSFKQLPPEERWNPLKPR